MRYTLSLLLLSPLLTLGCGNGPPPRSSPTPTVLGASVPASAIIDTVASEPTWYDRTLEQVLRLRGGVVTPVQDRRFSEAPSALRVLSDDTIVMLVGDELRAQPVEGAPWIETGLTSESAFDGTAYDDWWFVVWRLDGAGGYELCHFTGTTECVAEIPNVGGYGPALGVAGDGSVYVTDRHEGVYRWDGGQLDFVGTVFGGVLGFRAGEGGTLALGYSEVLAIEALEMRPMWHGIAMDVVGDPDDFVVLSFDSGDEIIAGCRESWLTSCPRRTVWTQYVLTTVSGGRAIELAHETCDLDHPDLYDGCDRSADGVAIDGESAVLVGSPLRVVPR